VDHKKYWTYIVCSRSGTLYIGMCNNIERRMQSTSAVNTKGSPASIIAIVWFILRALTMCEEQSIGRSN